MIHRGAHISRVDAGRPDVNGVPLAALERKHPEIKRITPELLEQAGFSSVSAYLEAGLPIPEGTVVSSIQSGGGGDYLSFSGWEAGISADPTEAQTGQLDEAMDGGTVTVDVSNTNAVDLTLTCAAAYRFCNQTGWPNCAAVEGVGGRIDGGSGVNAVYVLTTNIVIEWLAITSTDSPLLRTSTGANNTTWRYCVLRDTPTTSGAALNGTGSTTMHTCFIYVCYRSVRNNGGTLNCYNISAFGATGDYNFYNQSGTMGCDNCIGLDAATADYDGTIAGDYNVSSDGTAPNDSATAWATSTAYSKLDLVTSGGETYVCHTAHTSDGTAFSNDGDTYWTKLTNRTWEETIRSGIDGEEDLHLINVRRWEDDVQHGSNFDGGSPEAAFDSATRGTPSDAIATGTKISDNMLNITFSHDTARVKTGFSLSTAYVSGFVKIASDTLSNGDNFALPFYAGRSAWSTIFLLKCRKDSGNIQVRPLYQGSGGSAEDTTWTTINAGQWYWIKFKWVSGSTFEWFIDGGSAIDSKTAGPHNLVEFGWWCYQYSGTVSCNIHVERVQLTTTDPTEPDDSTSPYGDTLEDLLLGGDESATIGSTDIDGETISTWYIGADAFPAAAPPGGSWKGHILAASMF